MSRPTGAFKRAPAIDPELRPRYARISKAAWAEIARDLYLQINGENQTDAEWMADAERRNELLEQIR